MSNRLPAAFIRALWNVTTEEQKQEIVEQADAETLAEPEDS